MSRKNTQTLNSIHRMCRVQNMDEKVLYTRSKLILSAYRDICWSTVGRADQVREDLVCYCGSQLDDALIYLETFAPDEAREQFEKRIQTLFETRCRIASGKAMKATGIMILLSSHSPFPQSGKGITQWGRPGENHGEVRFLWSRLAADRLTIPR